MAGNINSPGVHWNAGDTTGRAPGGASTALPTANITTVAADIAAINVILENVPTASGVPSGAPVDALPFYVDSADAKELYAWDGTAWQGPYGVSGI